MARRKRQPSRQRSKSSNRPLAAQARKKDARTAGEAVAIVSAPIFTPSIRLSELSQAVPRIDLAPVSSLASQLAQAVTSYQPQTHHSATAFPTPMVQTKVISVETLGALVRAHRDTLGLSQQSFAEHAGVGRRFISELENGKPSLEFDKVLAVARAASIDLFATRKT